MKADTLKQKVHISAHRAIGSTTVTDRLTNQACVHESMSHTVCVHDIKLKMQNHPCAQTRTHRYTLTSALTTTMTCVQAMSTSLFIPDLDWNRKLAATVGRPLHCMPAP